MQTTADSRCASIASTDFSCFDQGNQKQDMGSSSLIKGMNKAMLETERDNAVVARSALSSPCFSVGGSRFESCPSTPVGVDFDALLRRVNSTPGNAQITHMCTPGGREI